MVDLEATLRSSLDGRYAVEGEVGRGGMSVVFRARDLKHNRTVAIKVLKPELSEQVGADRFQREVEFAATLTNPHILPMFDSGEAGGQLYYVMPCIEGGTLRDKIDNEGPLEVQEAIGIARNVAVALEAAHTEGIVHRDIKPSNILFSGDEAVVADFGIAHAVTIEDADRLTQSGLSVGSPAFMSPEQAGGDPVDGRADLYSLGCVLYTMLAGEPPFVRSTAQATITAQMADPPPSIRDRRPEVPKGVDEIILTALQKSPSDRFASATELIAALDHPELMPKQAKQRRRRRRLRVSEIALAVTVGVLGVSYLAWRAYAPEPLPPTDANRVMVFPLLERGDTEPGTGLDAAITIGNALNYADPLTFVDGWTWLDAERRADVNLLTSDVARQVALEQRARWYVTGTILGAADSATVTLLLHDALADTSAARELAIGTADFGGVTDAGLAATTRLLPVLLEPGREFDPSVLAASRSSSPVAMLEYVEGEKAYRSSRFAEALLRYQAALLADSTWAFAAFKAAQAASWVKQEDLALQMVDRALVQADRLPPKYASFARGLHGYLTADPDLAIAGFETALAADSGWAEPWMALGEVYYHLQPAWEHSDAAARSHFERSVRADSSFVVPLYHLTQMALREGDMERAERLTAAYRQANPAASMVLPLELSLRCVLDGARSIAWDSVVAADASLAAEVGLNLIEGLKETECGEATFRALLDDESAVPDWRRAAASTLASVWLARGRVEEAVALLDSTVAHGEPGNMGYFPLLAIAGYPAFEARGEEAISFLPEDLAGATVSTLWFLGWWAHHHGDVDRLRKVTAAALAADTTSRLKSAGLAASLAARMAATEGDTARALALLAAHPPRGEAMNDLEWDWDSPLPFARLLYAELLLATGDYERAIGVAEGFDGRGKIYLPLVPRSLEIRAEAANALGAGRRGAAYQQRAELLGNFIGREL